MNGSTKNLNPIRFQNLIQQNLIRFQKRMMTAERTSCLMYLLYQEFFSFGVTISGSAHGG